MMMTITRSILVGFAVVASMAACSSSGNDAPAASGSSGTSSSSGAGGSSGASSGGAGDSGVDADGVKNGDETDVDCGGSNSPACADGKGCAVAQDCTSGVCSGSICQAPSATDGVKNGDETGVDCGGSKAPKCPTGKGCLGDGDCDNVRCDTGAKVCKAPANDDGYQNGSETDVDCGGDAPKCAIGKKCAVSTDCANVKCDDVAKVCSLPANDDGFRNGSETDVDCGGGAPTNAPRCAVGKACAVDGDCNDVRCNPATKVCDLPANDDGYQNGSETDVDCGGGAPTNAPRCGTDQKCLVDGDCNNVACHPATKLCNAPTSSDGRRNGTETDVDCGGGAPTNAPGCADDRSCIVDGDCASGVCNTAGGVNRCVAGRSCKTAETAGITTCGRGETTDATPQHESCCRSLPLPNTPSVRLDKYEVTAGRIRQFIQAVGPNLRQWATNEIAANTPTGQRLASDLKGTGWDLVPFLPASANPGVPLNLVTQLGGTIMDGRRPSTSQGCFVDDGAYGHNTYWWDHDTLKSHFGNGIAARRFSQATYDEKPINCSPYWVYAAFCAWDGGRMPTLAEINQVWTSTYPWGASWGTVGSGLPVQPAGGVDWRDTVNNKNNQLYFYGFPAFGNDLDISGYIAAPGRFFLDATATKVNGESWQDLAANQMEMLKINSNTGGGNFCDFNVFAGAGDVADVNKCSDGGTPGVERAPASAMPRLPWVGGSWEVHNIGKPSYNFGPQVQYGKTGVRCAR